ncbi:MAG: toxic anion resistance protein [Clostridia bacterium]|nr:toxic anion resistance protein [Clostridia bacterium]
MGEFSQFALVPEQGVVPEMAQLDSAMQSRIREMAGRLNVRDGAQVAGFGARAQKEMGAFSDIALAQMLQKDTGNLSGTMKTLAEQITACSFTAQAKGFFRKMFGGAAGLDEVRAQYEKAEPKINACADEMTDRRVMLMRDSALLERLYERNENLYRELCSLIVIGDEAIRQAKARGEEAHIVSRLERRVEDIRVTQLASTQLAAQIRMIQGSDSVTCEKLKTALEVTIPLWKSQMAAALGLARATDSLNMARRMEKDAARGMRRGAKELRAQTDAYAKAASESDRQRAEETAKELLAQLDEIEAGLKAREMPAQA